MPKFSRVFLLLLILNTLLFPAANIIKKAIVEKGELRLFFSKTVAKNSVKHFTLKNPDREVYDFKNTRIAHNRVPLGLGDNVHLAQNSADTVRVVITGYKYDKPIAYQPIFSDDHYHIVLPKNGNTLPAKRYKAPQVASYKEPKKYKPVNTKRDKLVVIDAGHGGHDAGAVAGGKKEKDLVLQISKKLEKQLKNL